MFDSVISVRKGDGSEMNGTSLKGYFEATYNELVEAFGEPTYNDMSGDDKVSTEWVLVADVLNFGEEDTAVATVYDWKSGTFARDNPFTPYRWHIGGHSMSAQDIVAYALHNEVQQ